MPFQVNDRVMHPKHGLGQISEIATRSFPGTDARLYYEVAFSQSTVWVPVDSDNGSGLRSLTPAEALDRYRQVLSSPPTTLDGDHRQRRAELNDHLREGSFQVLCEMVRDLTWFGWHKPLRESDAAMLRRARDGLTQEWAAIEDITLPQATEEIDALLQAARKAFAIDGEQKQG